VNTCRNQDESLLAPLRGVAPAQVQTVCPFFHACNGKGSIMTIGQDGLFGFRGFERFLRIGWLALAAVTPNQLGHAWQTS
jgi:hypothetical protein